MGILQRFLRILRAELTNFADTSSSAHFDSAEDEELRRIIEQLNETPKQHPPASPRAEGVVGWAYRTLGISPTATNEEIKHAYRRAIRQVHPDRLAHVSEQERKKAERRAQEINRAYAILKAVRNF